jgi:hypothetical protein
MSRQHSSFRNRFLLQLLCMGSDSRTDCRRVGAAGQTLRREGPRVASRVKDAAPALCMALESYSKLHGAQPLFMLAQQLCSDRPSPDSSKQYSMTHTLAHSPP